MSEEVREIVESSKPVEEKIALLEVLLARKKDEVKEIRDAIKEQVQEYKSLVEQMKKGQTRLEVEE